MTAHRLWLLLACAGCGSARARAPDRTLLWFEVQTAHFIVRTDTSAEEARVAAHRLEVLRAALQGAAPWRSPKPVARPWRVLLLADQRELQEFVRKGFLGVTWRDASGEDLLVLSAGEDYGAVLKHELAHAFNNAVLLRQPRWLSEGLASYLETVQVARDESSAEVGDVNQPRRAWFYRGQPAFGPVLGRADLDLSASPERDLEEFYAQSWLLVHLLLNERRAQLDQFVGGLASGSAPDAAFRNAFGSLTAGQLDREARQYLDRGRWTDWVVKLKPVAPAPAARPLSSAEARAVRAQLHLLALNGASAAEAQRRAREEAEQALALDPGNPTAASVLFAAMDARDPRPLGIARAAVERHPRDSRSWSLLAAALPDGPGDRSERLAALQRAAELGTDDVNAQTALAFEYANHARAAEAVALARRATELAPGSPVALDALAVALAANGSCTEASATEQRALDVLPDRAPAAAAQQLRQRQQLIATQCSAAGAASTETAPRHDGPCKTAGPILKRRPGLKPKTRVSVQYTVDARGSIGAVEPEKGLPAEIARALVDYLRGCKFVPAQRAGVNVESRVTETFAFGPAT
jgi:tetratricopeptide (TPR) repeat protein